MEKTLHISGSLSFLMCKMKELTFLSISSGLVFYILCTEQVYTWKLWPPLFLFPSCPHPSPFSLGQTELQVELTQYSGRGQPWLCFFRLPHMTAQIRPPIPGSLLAGGEIWNLSRQGGFLCFCKSLKWPIFSFAALLSPHNIFFSCSEIHSPSLETWALYRKSLACTSTNGWVLFPVCSSWCCKGFAKNYWLRHKSKKNKMDGNECGHIHIYIYKHTDMNMIKFTLKGKNLQRVLLIHSWTPCPCSGPTLYTGGGKEGKTRHYDLRDSGRP